MWKQEVHYCFADRMLPLARLLDLHFNLYLERVNGADVTEPSHQITMNVAWVLSKCTKRSYFRNVVTYGGWIDAVKLRKLQEVVVR